MWTTTESQQTYMCYQQAHTAVTDKLMQVNVVRALSHILRYRPPPPCALPSQRPLFPLPSSLQLQRSPLPSESPSAPSLRRSLRSPSYPPCTRRAGPRPAHAAAAGQPTAGLLGDEAASTSTVDSEGYKTPPKPAVGPTCIGFLNNCLCAPNGQRVA